MYAAAPTAFQIDFATREETLKYYVVTRNYPAAEFDSLDVVDKGFKTDDRTEIVFAKVPPANFTADDIQPQFLGTDSDVRIVPFKSPLRSSEGPGAIAVFSSSAMERRSFPTCRSLARTAAARISSFTSFETEGLGGPPDADGQDP